MEKEKVIEVLNTLIEINNDRIEGYETALNETEESDLKMIFSEFIQTSKNCKANLANEVKRLGGNPITSTLVTGKFFRIWMDVKSTLTGNNRKVILNSCEFGEDAALQTYKKILDYHADELSPEQLTMVMEQKMLIKLDHDKVKNLRDMEPLSHQ